MIGISGATKNLGVIGWPIVHSLSPAMQTAAIRSFRSSVKGLHSRTMTSIPTIPTVTAHMVDIISDGSLNA